MSLRRFNNYDFYTLQPVLAWNPLAMRCARKDAGCANCWHLRMADRLAANPKLDEGVRDCYRGEDVLMIAYEELPKSPRIIAVQFMGDLWIDNPRVDWAREGVLNAIKNHPQHIFLLLTKRPERVTETLPENCWLGTSVHNQESAEKRVPALLATRAAHKWLSVEPMLGEVDFNYTALTVGFNGEPDGMRLGSNGRPVVEWIACGAETGFKARQCDPEWIANVAAFCDEGDIPFYDKRKPSADGFIRREWPEEWMEKIGGAK
jgi:Bacteriophage protein gp37